MCLILRFVQFLGFHSQHPISLGANLPNICGMHVFQDDKTVPPQKDGARARSHLWQSLKGLSIDLNPSPRAT